MNKLGVLAKLHQQDERVGCALLDWAHTEHEVVFGELLAESGALALRHRLSQESQQLRVTWAITDGSPADGGPPLAMRYAESPGLDEPDRQIARRLADAHPRLYQVHKVVPRLWIELETFDPRMTPSGEILRVFSDRVSTATEPGSVILARVIDADELASFWGPVCGYPADSLPKLRAFTRVVDITTAEGSLVALDFDPDGYPPPLREGLALRTAVWGVNDDVYVGEQLEDSGRFASLGIEIGAADEPWAFAWLGRPRIDAVDLGGRPDDEDGFVELARIVLHQDRLIVCSTNAAVLAEVSDWLTSEVEGVIPPLLRAA